MPVMAFVSINSGRIEWNNVMSSSMRKVGIHLVRQHAGGTSSLRDTDTHPTDHMLCTDVDTAEIEVFPACAGVWCGCPPIGAHPKCASPFKVFTQDWVGTHGWAPTHNRQSDAIAHITRVL